MLEIKVDGIKEAIDALDELQKNAEEMEGEHEVSFDELFTSEFMNKNTEHDNFNDFTINSKLVPESTTAITKEIFEVIPDADFDEYVKNNSSYGSWTEMSQAAVQDYIKRKLGL